MSKLPRDVFIDHVFYEARKDKNIYFLTADLGARALDEFKKELPDQVIHMGISEQNMIDVAIGLSRAGKKVFCYAMASFIFSRAWEQIKLASLMRAPITLVGVGVGYGYDDAGPTHYALEDIPCMRVLPHMEIVTPYDEPTVLDAADLCLGHPGLRYVRLDRKYLPRLEPKDLCNDTCIIAQGYMVHVAAQVPDVDVIPNARIPFEHHIIPQLLNYERVFTLEEGFRAGGFGSAVLEKLNHEGFKGRIHRLGIGPEYHFENGGREYMHKLSGIDVVSISKRIHG